MTALRLIRVLDVPKSTSPRPTRRAPCPHTSSRPRYTSPAEESGVGALIVFVSAFFLAVPVASAMVPRLAAGADSLLSATQDGFTCTLVIGFSQTAQWYEAGGVFESVVGDDRWQLKWAGGAGVDRWSDADDVVWDAEVLSPCVAGSAAPDRIVFSVSGPFGEDEDAWVAAIKGSLDLIRDRYPSVRRIGLVPVVGGPSHRDCTFDGRRVRASWQHAHIDNAIEKVIDEDDTGVLFAGPSPDVRTCDDYGDALGHLTEDGAAAVGRMLAEVMRR